MDLERLQRVALQLADAVTAREEGKRVKLPVIQRSDAAGLIGIMHAQLDDAISRRDAAVGNRMACTKGCNACCRFAVVVTEGEAIAVAEYLSRPENADARARFEGAYPAWRAALGDLVDRTAEARSGPEAYQWTLAVRRSLAMCAFNHDGLCSIYPVRPSLCRKAHALDSKTACENAVDDAQIAYFEHPETEQIYEDQTPMRTAIHSALRPRHHFELLCESVHRLLAGSAAGRNEPCPCGSGKKFKKCHGAG